MRLCLIAICLVGVALNLLVFRRRHTSGGGRPKNSSIRNSMLLLSFMAAADSISLVALMLALSTQYLPFIQHIDAERQEWLLMALCKSDLFVIHSASAFSIWCWLLLSAVRYVAVYRKFVKCERMGVHRE